VGGEQRRHQAEDVDRGKGEADQSVVPKRIDPRLDEWRPIDDYGLIGVLGRGQIDDTIRIADRSVSTGCLRHGVRLPQSRRPERSRRLPLPFRS
jgi:hypothetical protein